MAKYCPKCGNLMADRARFCQVCGTSVERRDTTQPQGSQPAPASKDAVRQNDSKNSKTSPASSPKQKPERSRSSFLNVILSITLVIQLIVAGFWHPGFLRGKNEPGPGPQPILPTPGPTAEPEDTEGIVLGNDPDAVVVDVTLENSPDNPFLIEVDITQQELDETPVLASAAVSSEHHEVTAGSFKADFKDWNLEQEEDTWNVKALKPKEDSATGFTLLTYDFSLASGQHEFPTNVEIHMPRTAGEYEGSVIWYNMEAGCWEPVCYSVSEDGTEYIIHTDHFSPFSEIVNWFRKYTRNSYEMAGTIYDTVDLDQNGNPYPQLQKPVRMVDERVHDLLAWPQESKTVIDAVKTGTIPDDVAVTNFMNMFNRFGLGYGNTVTTPLYSWDEKLINGLAKMKIVNRLLHRSDVKMLKYTGVTVIQGSLLIFGIILTGCRILYQVCKGGDVIEVLKENAGDLTGLGIGGLGYAIGGKTGAALGWVGLVVFLGFEAYALAKPSIEAKPVDDIERLYRLYIIQNGHEMTNPGEEDAYSVADLTYGVSRRRWAKAIRTIFERNKEHMEKIPEEINELYDTYVNSFWDLTEEQRDYFYMQAGSEYHHYTRIPDSNGQYELAHWEDPEDIEVYKKHTKAAIVSGTQDILLELIDTYQAQAECEIKSMIQNELLPRLNTDMVFLVRDTGMLNSDEFFDKSPLVLNAKTDPWLMQEHNHVDTEGLLEKRYPYSYTPDRYDLYEPTDRFLYFADQAPYLFEPGNEKGKNVYLPPAFYPHINEDSSEVFACKYYYYMMMGNPEMLFINSEQEGNRDISPASYSIDVPSSPDSDGKLYAMVVIDRNVRNQFEPQTIRFTSNDYRQDGEPVTLTFSLRSDGSFELTMPQTVISKEITEKDMGDEISYQMQMYKDYKCQKNTVHSIEAYTLKGKLRKEDLYDDRTGWTCYAIDNSMPVKSTDASGLRESYTAGLYDPEKDEYSTVNVYRRNETVKTYTITLSLDDHPSPDSLGYYFSTSLSIRVEEENGTKKLKMKAILKGLGSKETYTLSESSAEGKKENTDIEDDVSYDLEFTGEADVPSKGFFWYHE